MYTERVILAKKRNPDVLFSSHSYDKGIVGQAKRIWRPGCVKTTDQSFVMHKTRRQHQQMENLMTCSYEVEPSGKPTLGYLRFVSKTAARKSISKKILTLDA
jgi:hypothetical protein